MHSTRQATRITMLGASAILALTCTTACGSGSAVERDRPPTTQIDRQVSDEPTLLACASAAPAGVKLRRSPPPDCGGHPAHSTWAEYRLFQDGR
jgi:hypothetical protein